MDLIDNLKEDFIEALMVYEDAITYEEAKDIWYEHEEEYLSKVFDYTSNIILDIVNDRIVKG